MIPLPDPRPAAPALELWGGHECTVNRVGDRWFDQTRRSGHQDRPQDLALFADLGIRKLRYPALWERIAPDDPARQDFAWTDERLPLIRSLGMEPILTLCHHGSGPHYTSLLHDDFSAGLARHAAATAERYPWVTDYTPVNEPVTTARFSAMYGFWYPHLRDERAFWVALLNQIDATRLAMRAIRRVNPAARLIQTDDLGFCHASPPLQQSADHQNERRWMGWDLLCGRVVPGHALWWHLLAFGLEDRLRVIADDPCPPDIIGVNHYLSSERYLDHRIDHHGRRADADRALGDCDGVPHVDVDAIRHIPDRTVGLAGVVEQAWQRYGIPVAITECHYGSTREEQARWFSDGWRDALTLQGRGVDIRAVTAWALLGSHDWDRMVTRSIGHYEPGVFDVRDGRPRPTLMVPVLRDLAAGREPTAPALDVPGWWRAERRHGPREFRLPVDGRGAGMAAPLMIVGDDGVLTRLAVQACEVRGLPHCLGGLDAAAAMRPWALLDARSRPGPEAVAAMARFCAASGIVGATMAALAGDDAGGGATNLLLVEAGPLFTADDDAGLPVDLLDALDAGVRVRAARDTAWNGVYGPSLVDGLLDLLLDGVAGRVRFAVAERWSVADLARALAAIAGHDAGLVVQTGAPRFRERLDDGVSWLPPITTVLERFVRDRRWMRSLRGSGDPAPVVTRRQAAG